MQPSFLRECILYLKKRDGNTHMQTTDKRREKASLSPFFLSTASLILKKAPTKKEPTTSVDFHLEIVKKIDELLKDTKPKPPTRPLVQEQPNRMPPPVEERSPFARRPGHEEITFDAPASALNRPHPTPEEFKTDFPLSTNPSFRFITSLDSVEDFVTPRRHDTNKVEIIDLNDLREKPSLMRIPEESDDDDFATPRHVHDDIAFLSAMADIQEPAMDRSQLYTLQAKTKDKDVEYIPDLTERIQQIKQHEQEEERHRQEQVAKEKKQRELDEAEQRRRQEKAEAEAQRQKEKEQKKKQKKTEDQKETPTKPKLSLFHRAKPQTPPEEPAAKTADDDDEPPEPEIPDEPIGPATDKLTKKQLKLEAKKAKLETKKQKQREKLLLKEQRKKDRLKTKMARQIKKSKPAKHAKDTTTSSQSPHDTPATTTPDLDDDLLRFLQLTDKLLGQLPDDVIERFANSQDFELYEKIMTKYHLK